MQFDYGMQPVFHQVIVLSPALLLQVFAGENSAALLQTIVE